MACLLRHSCWVKLQMQLFLDVETLSVLRVTPFSGGNPVNVMVLPRWGPPVAAVSPKALRHGSNHIVRRQRPPDPLQLELTHGLDLHRVLDLRQHSRADEDLPRLGFVAKARGDVGHRPDGGIVEAALEADGAERGEAVRNADAEANLVPQRRHVSVNAPMASRTSSAMSTAWSAGFSTGTGSLKTTITPSPA